MKELYLKDLHVRAQARFGAFAGTNMPITYPLGVLQEHLHTRKEVSLFDISHMKIIAVSGKYAAEFLSYCLPLDLVNLAVNKNQYSFFLNEQAGIIDDLIISKLALKEYYLIVNAANAEQDLSYLNNLSGSYEVAISMLELVILALQGPKAKAVMAEAGLGIAGDLCFMQNIQTKDIFISRSGYSGEDGFEIALKPSDATELVKKLLSIPSVKWAGLASRDSLRLEAGLCLHGQDIDANVNPVEANLLWAIPKQLRSKNAPYIGAQALGRAIETKPLLTRCGFLPLGKQPVRAGALIYDVENKVIGKITSGTFSPCLEKPIAMGYLERSYIVNKRPIYAQQRGKNIELELTTLPFVAHKYYNSKN